MERAMGRVLFFARCIIIHANFLFFCESERSDENMASSRAFIGGKGS